MAILSNFTGAMNREEPVVGSGSSSIGTTVFVMNTDAKTVTSDSLDPYLQMGGTPGAEGNIRPIVVPSMGLHLEVNIAYTGAVPTADLPVVCIYGEVPAAKPGDRYWPVDVDSTICGTADSATNDTSSFWVPLMDWDNAEVQSDAAEVDFSNLIALNPDAVTTLSSGDGTPGIALGAPRRVYLSGCTRVICTVRTVADNATAAVIIGRFVG
jgi:hypothetical protein